MIDIAALRCAALPSPAAPPDTGEGAVPFATLLRQAHAQALRDVPLPDLPDAGPGDRAVIDHAVRFDARGVLDMAAVAATAAAHPVVADHAAASRAVGVSGGEGLRNGEVALPARMLVLPAPTQAVAAPVSVVRQPLPVASGNAASAVAGEPVAPPLADEPEPIAHPVARPRARTFATTAPQVAVVALADGLAVVAAVGALSDADRHRLRDAIAATVSRHGYHPRTVTLLAMPAPVRFPEP